MRNNRQNRVFEDRELGTYLNKYAYKNDFVGLHPLDWNRLPQTHSRIPLQISGGVEAFFDIKLVPYPLHHGFRHY